MPQAYQAPHLLFKTPSEIGATPLNGLSLVSTFSGCGGSCLGFRMAGYHPLWASEFVPAAAETYHENHPDTPLDTRDIRTVTAEMILEATGLKRGELDVLEGSPPCASFSTAGKRQAGWGDVRSYSDTKQRVDDLFFEFVRLLDGLRPRVFVAENVSGLVKGVAKGYFKEILAAMKACGYVVQARLLDAQWLGVPQQRQRIIFVGVRNDLAAAGFLPVFPSPLPYRYSVRDALPHILRHGTAPPHEEFTANGRDPDATMVDSNGSAAPTIVASGVNKGAGLVAARVIHDTSGNRSQGDITDKPCPAITVGVDGLNSYHYRVESASPDDTDISRFAIGREWDKMKPGGNSARYLNLKRAPLDAPSQGVSAAGGGLGAAALTHPIERRKFTIAELRRICAFPDDFVLTGTYAQQWERLGRAVPPLMMRAVAEALRDAVLLPARERGL